MAKVGGARGIFARIKKWISGLNLRRNVGIDELKLPVQTELRRKVLTKQQKQLNAAEREKNAAHSFELASAADVSGKTVLLVDDVCTTGSSLAACVAWLKDAGAARVICAVVAKTEHK